MPRTRSMGVVSGIAFLDPQMCQGCWECLSNSGVPSARDAGAGGINTMDVD